jgi:hypothetical protein
MASCISIPCLRLSPWCTWSALEFFTLLVIGVISAISRESVWCCAWGFDLGLMGKMTKVWLYRKHGTLTATYDVSYFSRRTATKDHVANLRMLRLCEIRRHSREWLLWARTSSIDVLLSKGQVVRRRGPCVSGTCESLWPCWSSKDVTVSIKKCINRPLQCYHMLTFLQNQFH